MVPKLLHFSKVVAPFWHLFSGIDLLKHFGRPLARLWLPLAPFWIPLAPFWFPLAPFWLFFGSLRLPFGDLWLNYGALWLLFSTLWVQFWNFLSTCFREKMNLKIRHSNAYSIAESSVNKGFTKNTLAPFSHPWARFSCFFTQLSNFQFSSHFSRRFLQELRIIDWKQNGFSI